MSTRSSAWRRRDAWTVAPTHSTQRLFPGSGGQGAARQGRQEASCLIHQNQHSFVGGDLPTVTSRRPPLSQVLPRIVDSPGCCCPRLHWAPSFLPAWQNGLPFARQSPASRGVVERRSLRRTALRASAASGKIRAAAVSSTETAAPDSTGCCRREPGSDVPRGRDARDPASSMQIALQWPSPRPLPAD